MQPGVENTTRIPHILIRDWMPRLNDVEFRVLMIIADQTYGWVKHKGSKERKERDRISLNQMSDKTGRGKSAISAAIRTLSDKYDLIRVYDARGAELRGKRGRMSNGYALTFGINLHPHQNSLFDAGDNPKNRQ